MFCHNVFDKFQVDVNVFPHQEVCTEQRLVILVG